MFFLRMSGTRDLDFRERVEDLKSRVDLVEVIGSCVPLKRAGRHWVGLCPFHKETKPSFSVSPEKGYYRCFGCGAGGDAITFLMTYNHLDFKEAVQELARRAGVRFEFAGGPSRRVAVLREANETAAEFFASQLFGKAGKGALDYVRSRGFDDAVLRRFRIGYAPAGDALLTHMKRRGVDTNVLLEAGLAVKRDGGIRPFLWKRLVFPITNPGGRVVAFGGRVLEETASPKYLNTAETPLFRKSETLYGLAQLKIPRGEPAIVTEGYTDVMMAHQHGLTSVCATLGTAFTDGHSRLLKRFADEVVVVFDSDSAGRKAADRSIDSLLSAGLSVKVAVLPEGEDLCDHLRREGAESTRRLLSGARRFIEYLIECSDDKGVEGKRRTVKRVAAALACIPDEAERRLWSERVAALMNWRVRPQEVEDAAHMARRTAAPQDGPDVRGAAALEWDLVTAMIFAPELVERVAQSLPPEEFEDAILRRIAAGLLEQMRTQGRVSLDELYEGPDGAELQRRVQAIMRRARERNAEEADHQKIVNCCLERIEYMRGCRELRLRIETDDLDALRDLARRKLERETARRKRRLWPTGLPKSPEERRD